MDKHELQVSTANRLTKSKRLMCEWATGTGKTGVCLEFLKQHPILTCLVLVPEQNNISNWEEEFKRFEVPMDNVKIACYASFHKFKYTQWGLVVFDEAPHVDTDKRTEISKTVQAKYILALGARIDDDERRALTSVYGQFDVSHIGFDAALTMGLLPYPEIYVLHMQMDNDTPRFRFNGIMHTEREYYAQLKKKVDAANNTYLNNPTQFNKTKMLAAGSERKRFLGQMKQEAIIKICNHLESKGKRFLCFCSSIKQAEMIGGDNAFTSMTPKSAKVLEKFNNHEIDSLFVVGKLIEGQNLTDIECGVIGQLGGTERITIQSIGRVMRSKKPIIFVPVFDNTKDDSFLYTLTSNIPGKCIKHYNF